MLSLKEIFELLKATTNIGIIYANTSINACNVFETSMPPNNTYKNIDSNIIAKTSIIYKYTAFCSTAFVITVII